MARYVKTPADYQSDGHWDCGHAYDPSYHRDAWINLGRPTDREAAINVVRKAWNEFLSADGKAEWIRANAADIAYDAPGLDPAVAYENWATGWQSRAIGFTTHYMARWSECDSE